MCEPVSASTAMMAMMGTTVASTALSLSKQGELADAQEESARKSAEIQQAAINEQALQDRAATSEQMSARARQAAEDEARLRVVAGEHGVGGTSLDAQSQQIDFARATDSATLAANLGAKNAQRDRERAGVTAQTNSRLNQIQQPDWIGGALKIGTQYYAGQAGKKAT